MGRRPTRRRPPRSTISARRPRSRLRLRPLQNKVACARVTVYRDVDRDGRTSLDWDSYPTLRFSKVPEIEAMIVRNPDRPPPGMGECTFGPTAATVANAVAHTLNVRVRDMPPTGERIAATLAR